MLGGAIEKKQFWYWPALVIALLVLLALIQMARVNEPPAERPLTQTYTAKGALVHEDIKIPAHDFYVRSMNLNRRGKITGTFRTESIKSKVSVLVMDENNFNKWKSELDHAVVIQTGYVPAGRIAPVLEPGIYFLVIDNRQGDAPAKVRCEFILE